MKAGIAAVNGPGGFFSTPAGQVAGIAAIPLGLYLRRVTGKVPPLAVVSLFMEALAEDLEQANIRHEVLRQQLAEEAGRQFLAEFAMRKGMAGDMPAMWLRDP